LYAIIETGGKQYKVSEGDVVFLEKLNQEAGGAVLFDKVLACSSEGEMDFGTPYLSGVSVDATVLGHGKERKIVIFKYKAKKGYRKKQGHRQPYTRVRIDKVNGVAEPEGYEAASVPDAEAAVDPVGAEAPEAEASEPVSRAEADAGGSESVSDVDAGDGESAGDEAEAGE
jgi:large subunit ribosomal protein L21